MVLENAKIHKVISNKLLLLFKWQFWPQLTLMCHMSHMICAIFRVNSENNSLFRYSLEIKNPLRHSRSPQNRYNIPVIGISGAFWVKLSFTETYHLQAHFFVWKNQFYKTSIGFQSQISSNGLHPSAIVHGPLIRMYSGTEKVIRKLGIVTWYVLSWDERHSFDCLLVMATPKRKT